MNWRRIIATGTVAGMIAITGCSTNLPENNQGNRNGQRVADAANRRTDSYSTTRNRAIYNEANNTGLMGTAGTNRTTAARTGFNRSAAPRTNANRSTTARTTAPRATTTPSRSLNFGRPQGRIGNTFRYNNTNSGRTQALNTNRTAHSYDAGITSTEGAVVNNRYNMNMYQNRGARRNAQFNRNNQQSTIVNYKSANNKSTNHKNVNRRVGNSTGIVPTNQQTVAVMNNDEQSAFFKKNDDLQQPTTTPAPVAPSNTTQPAPSQTPLPTTPGNQAAPKVTLPARAASVSH